MADADDRIERVLEIGRCGAVMVVLGTLGVAKRTPGLRKPSVLTSEARPSTADCAGPAVKVADDAVLEPGRTVPIDGVMSSCLANVRGIGEGDGVVAALRGIGVVSAESIYSERRRLPSAASAFPSGKEKRRFALNKLGKAL